MEKKRLLLLYRYSPDRKGLSNDFDAVDAEGNTFQYCQAYELDDIIARRRNIPDDLHPNLVYMGHLHIEEGSVAGKQEHGRQGIQTGNIQLL